MSRSRTVAAALVAWWLAAAPASAGDRLRLALNGLYDAGTPAYADARGFTEFAEQARVESAYQAEAAAGFDLGLELRLTRRLAIGLSASAVRRDVSGRYAAAVPHPFFFERPRSASGALAGLADRERSLHLSLALRGGDGGLAWAVFGGPSLVEVEAELVERVSFEQSYPYDSIRVTATPSRRASDTPLGFHLGARLDYRFGAARRVGIGAELRFARARARLAGGDTPAVLDAGGLQGGAGLRLYF